MPFAELQELLSNQFSYQSQQQTEISDFNLSSNYHPNIIHKSNNIHF